MLVMGLLLCAWGVWAYSEYTDAFTLTARYDTLCAVGNVCEVPLVIAEDVPGPIYAYYELGNYFQNFRTYVQSISFKQLLGQDVTAAELNADCSPDTPCVDGVCEPGYCGLIFKSLFTDTFALRLDGATDDVPWTGQGIAWPRDLQDRYAPDFRAAEGDAEEVAVWLRVAALPRFRKLHRIIPDGLAAGTYTLTVAANYDVAAFDGSKSFVLATTTAFGTANPFFHWLLLCVGLSTIALAVVILAVVTFVPRAQKWADVAEVVRAAPETAFSPEPVADTTGGEEPEEQQE
eukprot:gnl/Ergobibamus_cyprinoides/656.p1 GENE.gnl/Ergobibamus_cyprinoides/656~~gnl/Ergobibamus_cyprinoides/656.p1  ORF type:complete len:331 (+),score=101.46 gnl/Ergobibamus_cyprinoides/656:126-995(+)